MSKRKKLRTAGEVIHPPKLPKNPRPGDSNGGPRSSRLGSLQHPNEAALAAPTELIRQEPAGPAISSFSNEETAAASLLGQLEEEATLLPPSQTSLGKFVPQFAKPRKTLTRKAETRQEDPERRAVSPEALPGPSAPLLERSPGPEEQMPADVPCPQQRGQNPRMPVPGEVTGSPSSDMASQNPVLEQGTSVLDCGNPGSSGPERAQVPGHLGPEGQLPCSGAEGTEPDRGAPQEGGTQQGTPEEGGSISGTPVLAPTLTLPCLKTQPAALDFLDPQQTPREAGGQEEYIRGGPACASLGTTVTEDRSTDAPETEQRAPGVAGPAMQADAWLPASPSEQAPQGCVALVGKTTAGSGESGPEDKHLSDTPGVPAAFWAVLPGNREPSLDAEDPGHPAADTGLGVDQTQVPGPAAEGLGRSHVLPLLAQLGDRQAAGSGSQHLEGGHEGLSLASCAPCPLEHGAATDGPLQEASACQGIPEPPTDPAGPFQYPLDSAGQAGWPESSAMELDFLPDSQLRDALDAPGLEAPPEQDTPTGDESGLCWPGPSPGAGEGDRVLATETQPRMVDASDTVRGLIVELSNLNRLIMSAHRDLEAFKRLGSRKARPPPCLAKGAGVVSRRDQPWRDL